MWTDDFCCCFSKDYTHRLLVLTNDHWTETATTPVPAETPAETPVVETPVETPKEDPVKESDEPVEKKSFFSSLCGCFGGPAPPAVVDVKDAPKEDEEKEETEEKPAEDEA